MADACSSSPIARDGDSAWLATRGGWGILLAGFNDRRAALCTNLPRMFNFCSVNAPLTGALPIILTNGH